MSEQPEDRLDDADEDDSTPESSEGVPGKPGRPKWSKHAVRAREARILAYCEQGRTTSWIADVERISQRLVQRILNRISKRALKTMDDVVRSKKTEQVAVLDYVKGEALQAWRNSLHPKKRMVKKKVEGASDDDPNIIVTQEIEESTGNPAYLDRALAAMADIRKILGIDSPTKIAQTDAEGKSVPPAGSLDAQADELRKIREEMASWKPGAGQKLTMNDVVPEDKPTEGKEPSA